MIKLNKQEMKFLQNHGVHFGEEEIISTSGHHKIWYVTESHKNMNLLRKYHKLNAIVKM